MAENQPNVVVFFTDQQRWDTTGVHGNPLDLTPNFDRFAKSGTHAYNSITCQPVCGPARSCLQTGLYATTTGCFRNGIPLPDDSKTLAHYFSESGYDTGYIGKWHLADTGSGAVPAEKRFGYQYWLASNVLEFTSDAYDMVMYDNDNQAVKLPGYRVDAQTDAAIRYIDQHQSNPFFLFLSYIEPHHQNHLDDYPPPDGYREKYTSQWIPPDLAALVGSTHQHLAGYYGMVKRLDEAFGRLLDALKSLGLADNTIVLFTSDHACHFKTRNSEYKRSCHDSSVRVPTALHGGCFVGGGEIREMVSLIDLPPTLLDAAGIPVPEQMQGQSILPLIRGEQSYWPSEALIQISESHTGRAIRSEKWKYSVRATGQNSGKDGGGNEYVEDFLYDLEVDPYELRNLVSAESHIEICHILRQRLIDRMIESGESAPEIQAATKENSGQRQISIR